MKKLFAVLVFVVFFVSYVGLALGAEKRFEGVTLKVASCQWAPFVKYMVYAKKIGAEMGMDVQVNWYPWDALRNKLLLDNQVKSPEWDIVMVDTKWVAEFSKLGVIDPLDKYINDPKISDKKLLNQKDWLISSAPPLTYGGKLMAMPTGSTFICLAYRTDLFSYPEEKKNFKAKYGYELKVPDTYQEFLDIARFFTRKKGELLMGKPLEEDFYGASHSNKKGDFLWHDYISYMVAAGADIIFDPKTMRPTWNSPQNIAVGKLYAEVAKTCPPGHNVMSSGESTSWFANGKVAMILEWSDRVINICEEPSSSKIIGKFEYALNPSWKGMEKTRPHATMDYPFPLGIFSHSKNKVAAYKLLEKMGSKDVMRRLTLEPGYAYPSHLKSLYNETDVLKRYRYPNLVKQIMSTKVYLFQHPLIPEYPEAMEIASLSVSEVLTGVKGIEPAYNEAQEKLETLFRKAGYIK
jgi:multiple sugar transport system substrate-binding protein